MAISLIFFAALAALGALFVARRVLRRIDAMNVSARAIMAGDLTRRLPVSGSDDELDRLARGLNEMLARIADLMAGMREVSDNIAHDLRTPLTRLRNHAEEALRRRRRSGVLAPPLERTIEESDGLIKIFDALLMIARAEAGADRAGMSAFDVGETVESVAELYEPLAEENGVALKVDAARGLTIVGNRELIGQAVANLIDNALKYGAGHAKEPRAESRSEIAVTARREGATVAIEVADHGPGIPAAERTRAIIGSCGWRARARALVPASACRSPRRWCACTAARCGSKTTRPASGWPSRCRRPLRLCRRSPRRRHERRPRRSSLRRAAARLSRRRAPAPRDVTRRARSSRRRRRSPGASPCATCCSASPITLPISGG